MAYRFLHTADVHLDSPLRSLAMRSPELAELVGDATRQAFVTTVDICVDEQVNALVIAGDLFDGDQTSMKTARFLAGQLARLHQASVKVLKIRGNHDNLSRISKQLVYPDNVTVFGGRAQPVVHRAGGSDVVFHGLSFTSAKAPESLLPKYGGPQEGVVNIGIMHTSLGGAVGHDVYAPASLSDMDAHGFDYWALGHVHARSVAVGRSTVVMPGMPQGRDIGEAGPKSVTLVTVRDDRTIEIAERPTAVARFERLKVDVSGAMEWTEVVGRIRLGLEGLRETMDTPQLVVRVGLEGETGLYWNIMRDRDVLLAEAEEAAMQTGGIWIEKLETLARVPVSGMAPELDPVLEIAEAMLRHAASQGFRSNVRELVLKTLADLPPEARGFAGVDEDDLEAFLHAIMTEGADLVTARLKTGEVR